MPDPDLPVPRVEVERFVWRPGLLAWWLVLIASETRTGTMNLLHTPEEAEAQGWEWATATGWPLVVDGKVVDAT